MVQSAKLHDTRVLLRHERLRQYCHVIDRKQILVSTARLDEAIAEAERMLKLARVETNRRLEGEALADMAYAHMMTLSRDHFHVISWFICKVSRDALQ